MKRRGTVYVMVLGLSVAVFVIAAGSLAVVRAHARAAKEQNDSAHAQAYAMSAIELGRVLIANDPNWRTNRSNGEWLKQSIDKGTLALSVVNPNGSLDNSIFDPVIATGVGVCGAAEHRVQITLNSTAQPYTCLNATLFGNQSVTLSSVHLTNNGIVGSNSNVVATSSLISGPVEAAGSITGGNYVGTTTSTAPSKSMPDATVFDYYVSNGTAISLNTVPAIGGIRTISRKLFTPSQNPFVVGSNNAMGIYVINCSGNRIVIQDTRILGTLVLLNVGANSIMQGAMVCSPAVSNYPTLLVQGTFTIAAGGTLSESGTPAVNFNPVGAPINGVTNSNSTDSFSTQLNGIFYSSGNLTVNSSPVFQGVVVSGGTLTLGSTIVASHDNTFANNPPPGFGLPPKMLPANGSWMQTVN